jgi:hypothetical protein
MNEEGPIEKPTEYKINADDFRKSLSEIINRRFGRGGETHCPNDGAEIIYSGLQPEHTPPEPYVSARVLNNTIRYDNGRWTEGGYCPECPFVTRRQVRGERLRKLEEDWHKPIYGALALR